MTTEARSDAASSPPEPGAATEHPGLALLVLVAAELMVVLDATIVNIALPSIRASLDMSISALAWVVTAYALAFGGLMLIGGRAGDLFGRLRVFRIGLVVFAVASLCGGIAPNAATLIGARVVQGIGAAITAPTALSLIATTFAEGRHRNRAMGLWAAMAGIGSTVGLLLGGLITEYLQWRWVLLINVPIAAVVLAGTTVLREPRRARVRLDLPGAITGTAGLLALVYAITRWGSDGLQDAGTLSFFAAALVLLAVFVVLQARGSSPMLPPRVLSNRTRGGAYVTTFFVGMGMFGTFYFLTLYIQQVLGYSAIRAGLAYLPFNVGIGIMATVSSRLVSKVPPRFITVPALAVSAAGMWWLSRLTPHSHYWSHLMPAMFVVALGLGATFVPMTVCAVHAVSDHDAGIASAVLNTAQQIGGAVGLTTLAVAAAHFTSDRVPDADGFLQARAHGAKVPPAVYDALTYGYTRAFVIAGAVFLVALVLVATVVNAGPQEGGRRH